MNRPRNYQAEVEQVIFGQALSRARPRRSSGPACPPFGRASYDETALHRRPDPHRPDGAPPLASLEHGERAGQNTGDRNTPSHPRPAAPCPEQGQPDADQEEQDAPDQARDPSPAVDVAGE